MRPWIACLSPDSGRDIENISLFLALVAILFSREEPFMQIWSRALWGTFV